MTVFYLLRHGEPTVFGRINGRLPGVGLSAKGRAEIAAVAERLAGGKIDAIYASPLQRTRETAEILADRLGLPIQYREDVIELDFGAALRGKPNPREAPVDSAKDRRLAMPQQMKVRHVGDPRLTARGIASWPQVPSMFVHCGRCTLTRAPSVA